MISQLVKVPAGRQARDLSGIAKTPGADRILIASEWVLSASGATVLA